MLKKDITFKDLDDVEVTKTYHFNLSELDLMDLEIDANTGLADLLKQVVDSGENREVLNMMKRLILISVGKREGTQFIKNDEVTAEFKNSGAYVALFVEIFADSSAGLKFLMGIFPSVIGDQLEAAIAATPEGTLEAMLEKEAAAKAADPKHEFVLPPAAVAPGTDVNPAP